jgi:hypothetical protein
MRISWKVPVLFLACAGVAYAQAVVALRGNISSIDSTRANIVIKTNSKSQLIVLPSTVKVLWGSAGGAAVTINNLREGMQVAVDAVKSPTGQLTAQTVTIIPSAGGVVPPTNPPNATDVTVGPGGGTMVNSGGDAGAINHVVAVRAVKLGHPVGEIRVNGATVFRFRGTKGGNPYTRAQTVAGRMNSAAMANLRPAEIGVTRYGREYVVTARGTGLITADSVTAAVNRTSAPGLAALWANNLRRQLAAAR